MDEPGDLGGVERGQPEVQAGLQVGQQADVAGLVGPERRDDRDVAAGDARRSLPASHELGGEGIGPLAVVEDDDRRALGGAESVEEGVQGLEVPGLSVGLGPGLSARPPVPAAAPLEPEHRSGPSLRSPGAWNEHNFWCRGCHGLRPAYQSVFGR